MTSNHEEDEFVAVRVQDPRVQNEGSWNSYVDYKIFLHTNSKAFTAKTSCVRRRYSEFEWLKKKLQKNAGLVPVPELPGKSLFYFSNVDFLEKRRKGLQLFLDKVVHMTVCLSDSQLHLFLQTQLPVGHIQDCVQGHTPYTVTEAILTYASSNQGLAQAQEDDLIKDPYLTISYESMESPAPRQPRQQSGCFSPELSSCGDTNPLQGLQDQDPVEVVHGEKSSVRISQKSSHLKVVLEDSGRPEATFYLGDSSESLSSAEQVQQRIQTPVEVHSSTGSGFEDSVSEGEVVLPPDEEEKVEERDSNEEADERKTNFEPEKSEASQEILDFKENYCEKQVLESDVRSQGTGEDVCTENPVLSEGDEIHVPDVKADEQTEPDDQKGDKPGGRAETPHESEIYDEAHEVNGVPELESDSDDAEGKQEVDFAAKRNESDEGCSLPSSDESIVQISDEEAHESDQVEDSFAKMPPVVEASSRSIMVPVEEQQLSAQEDEDLQFTLSGPSKSADLSSAAISGDLTEN